MFRKHNSKPLRITFFFELVSLALIASSCGHTQASPPQVSMDVVMKTVHDYGSGHAGLLSPGSSAKPEENDEPYTAHINSLLMQQDFGELERIAKQNRTEKGRVLGGYWKNHEFFSATGSPHHVGLVKDSDYLDQIKTLNKWIAAYPESATARISLANLYANYANFARGSGYANTVTDSQWQLFYQRTDLAKELLLEAARLKERDPNWYFAMQQVAHNEGWSKSEARDLLDQAISFEPGYYHFYRMYAQYLLPQWYGQPGDILAFAEEISSRFPEPDSSILDFQIVSSLACYCEEAMTDLGHVSYSKVRQGYTNLTRLYGTSNLTANRFAFMATTIRDKPSAHEAFAAIVTMDSDIWYSEAVFDSARDWAESP